MKVSLSWLKELLPLHQSPEEIASALTLAGLEEEGIEERDGDVLFEIGLTPNLGHCLSILGIARELSALLSLPLNERTIDLKESGPSIRDKSSITVQDSDQCLGYACRLVLGIKVAPSPLWLQQRLQTAGIRPINNVVDVGNYVMFELGQPLHMFDFDKVEGPIQVKRGSGGLLTTLDGIEREIFEGAPLIVDSKKPLAFAGVMGGESTAVTETTHSVLIEAAHFSPEAIRRSCKKLGLRTDSSHRFERGIDPLAIPRALELAAHLLQTVAGGTVCKGILSSFTGKEKRRLVQIRPKRASQILGVELSEGEIVSLLARLEIELSDSKKEGLLFSIPSYRNDLHAEIDLIEEVGRMYGINNIPRKIPRHVSSTLSHAPLYLLEEKGRRTLISLGLQELLTCDLISPEQAQSGKENGLREADFIRVLHPASVDQSVLRPSLLPGLLQTVKFNLDRQTDSIAAFEVGHVHFMDGKNPRTEPAAAIVLTGHVHPHHFERRESSVDFFHMKGHIENLLAAFGVEEALFTPSHLHAFHPGRQASISVGSRILGAFGEVHPKHLETLGIGQRVYFGELSLLDLSKCEPTEKRASPLPQFPGSERDWTVNLLEKVPIGSILRQAEQLESPLLEKIELLDLYKSEKIGKDRKNATFRFYYRDLTKTVEYGDVDQEHKRVIASLEGKLKDGTIA